MAVGVIHGVTEHLVKYLWVYLLIITIALVLRKYRKIRGLPPGPWGIPFLGVMPWMSNDIIDDFMRYGKKYGDIFSLYIGDRLVIVLNSYSVIKEAFIQRGDEFSSRPPDQLKDLVDFHDPLFNCPYEKKWQENKNLALQALQGVATQEASLEKQLRIESSYLVKLLKEHLGPNGEVDPKPFLCCTMANVMCSMLFNTRYDWDDPVLQELLGRLRNWQADLMDCLGIPFTPFGRSVYSITIKRLNRDTNGLKAHMLKFVNEHIQTFNPEELRDIIDFYIKTKGDKLDKEELAATMILFFPDAVDTMPCLLHWLMIYMAMFPDVQQKIHNEIQVVTGSHKPVSLDDKPKLTYVQATVMEAMRVSNLVPVSPAHAPIRDTSLRGYRIPKDCGIFANFLAVHLDPEIWEDPSSFRPERFIDARGCIKRNDALMPFSIGDRACGGQFLTKTALFLFFTNIMRHFRFRFPFEDPNEISMRHPTSRMVTTPKSFMVAIENLAPATPMSEVIQGRRGSNPFLMNVPLDDQQGEI